MSQAQGRIQSFPPTCTGRCFERNSKSLRQNENSPQKGVLGPPDSPVVSEGHENTSYTVYKVVKGGSPKKTT